jgi:hypothetical protein
MGRIIHFVIILLLCRGILTQTTENAERRTPNIEQPNKLSGGTQAMIDKGQVNDFLRSAQNELGQDILIF